MPTLTQTPTVADLRRLLKAARALPGCLGMTLSTSPRVTQAHAAAVVPGFASDAASGIVRDHAAALTVALDGRLEGLGSRTIFATLKGLRALAKAPVGAELRYASGSLSAWALSSTFGAYAEQATAPVADTQILHVQDAWLLRPRAAIDWPEVWRIAPAATRDPMRYALAGVWVYPEGLAATDSYRLAVSGAPGREASGFVPASAIDALSALGLSPEDLEGGRDWVGTERAVVTWAPPDEPRLPRVDTYAKTIRALSPTCTTDTLDIRALRRAAKPKEVDGVEIQTDGAEVELVPFADYTPRPALPLGRLCAPDGRARVLARCHPDYLAWALESAPGAPLRIESQRKPLGLVAPGPENRTAIIMPTAPRAYT